jgi:tRNA(His) guanylyltransferase
MSQKLKERIASYQIATDYRLLPKVPLIITINGRAFSKLTSLLSKPYDSTLAECMFSTTLRLVNEVEGCLFAYQYNDEIVLVTRNDQSLDTVPWYDNKIQKIVSAVSSLATLHFNECASSVNLNLLGTPIFTTQVFAVPNISEAINTIVYKQQHNFLTSIQFSCFYELLNKSYDKSTIKDMLSGITVDEKIDLLKQECNVEFNAYPSTFRRGAACYKIPKVSDGIVKNKWALNSELPIFTKDQSFLSNIFKNGADIFREDNL